MAINHEPTHRLEHLAEEMHQAVHASDHFERGDRVIVFISSAEGRGATGLFEYANEEGHTQAEVDAGIRDALADALLHIQNLGEAVGVVIHTQTMGEHNAN